MTAEEIKKEINALGNKNRAEILQRYFKTKSGEYGEGDLFLGLTVPEQRKIAKKYKDLPLDQVVELIQSRYHEHRLTGLFILTDQFKNADEPGKATIYNLYLQNTIYVNNWDLVDATAPKIVGEYLLDKPAEREVLYHLAHSENLWERRIAIMATNTFIRHKMFGDAEKISAILVKDSHDLIHKAVGWMLREIGKKDQTREEKFLKEHHHTMPRTMLRNAVEKFGIAKKRWYMKKKDKS
jgi:3-methyladenine DNA glycosylase AlkD